MQETLAEQNWFEEYGKKTRGGKFPEKMEKIVPWSEVEALVRLYYPKDENGRPLVGLPFVLRVYRVQAKWNIRSRL